MPSRIHWCTNSPRRSLRTQRIGREDPVFVTRNLYGSVCTQSKLNCKLAIKITSPRIGDKNLPMSTAKQSQDAAANSQEIRRHGSEHLAQYKFQPGQSGNPAGRPKKLPITDAIRAELEHLGKDG